MQKSRELWIDYTKMFACILVVVGHLLQGLNKANIQWNENLYDYINTFIYIFHMPLFMCLSGYLYKRYSQINDWKDYLTFVRKKLINLGVPYVIFYLAYVLINMLFSSSVNSQKGIQDILNILTHPIAPFWFLYALFCIFLIVPLLEKLFKNNRNLILGISILLHILNIYFETGIYAIDIIMEYFVYFYVGAFGVGKIKDNYKNINIMAEIIIFIILSLGYCYIVENNIISKNITLIFKFLLAILGVIVNIKVFKNLVKVIEKYKILNIIAKNTFPIYLMHTTFSAGIRIILLKFNISNFYIHFILGLVLGILGPIIVEKILEKIKYGNIILYPLKTLKEVRKEKYENSNDRA